MGADPGQPSNYGAVVGANPASFADKFRQMRQRDVASAAIDAAVREQLQVPIAQSFGVPSGYFSKQS